MASAVLRERSVKSRDRMSMRRVIIKQSYLKKLARVGASFKSPRRRWFVFGVMNGTDPYLEYYETEESTFTGSPINMFFLDSCKQVVKNKAIRQKNIFTLVMRDRDVTLVAETRVLMDEWCSAITRKLQSIGIFLDDDDDHVYVMNPVSKPLTMEQRERFYPSRPSHAISCDRSQSAVVPEHSQSEALDLPLTTRSGEEEQEAYEATRSPTIAENSYTVPAAERAKLKNSERENGLAIFMPDASADQDVVERRTPSPMDTATSPLWPVVPTTPTPASWVMFDDMPSLPNTPGAGPVTSPPTSPTSPQYMNLPSIHPLSSEHLVPPIVSDFDPNLSLISPKLQEASGETPVVSGWNMPPPDSDAPPLYTPHAALERGANRSLKHSQIEHLEDERTNQGGVQTVLKRRDCLYAIALVDCFHGVWISGWNQAARPHLHNAFHIGDKVISINGQVVENSKMAMRLLKQCAEDDKITFILKRLPNAKLLAMKRNYESEDLGIRRNGGTAEILGVDELGPAGQAGLTVRTMTQSGDDLTNWWITEVNHRPINLFFKDDEIEKRLNAVGLDISAVVQPMDFIMELRKKLKTYRNYKDFIVQ